MRHRGNVRAVLLNHYRESAMTIDAVNSNVSSPWATDMKWPQMTALQKVAFIGKLMVALVTFGFAFPNLMD